MAIAGIAALQYSHAATNPNLKGDFDNNNVVNLRDLSILLTNWGNTSPDYDLNGDNKANLNDLSI